MRFHVVGAGSLLTGTLVFLALLELDVAYWLALAGDYAAGILFSYYMNKHFTFRATPASDLGPLSVTTLGYLVTYGLNLLLLAGAVELLSLPVVYSQLVIMLLALLNFAAFKYLVFGLHAEPPAAAQGLSAQTASTMLASEYQRLVEVEAGMWWFTSLHADLFDIIDRHFGRNKDIRILDAGCGTGGFLQEARRRGYRRCLGLDISALAVDHCRQRGLKVLHGSIADGADLGRAGNADLIVAIDVICSLPDEQQRRDFFSTAARMLNDGGLLIVQTPAFPCLGGIHDLAVGVNRRYTRGEMQQLLTQAGLRDVRLRYRLVLLTPLVLAVRSLQRLKLRLRRSVGIESDVRMPPPLLNSLLFRLQRTEDRWLPFRPFGTSLQILVGKAEPT